MFSALLSLAFFILTISAVAIPAGETQGIQKVKRWLFGHNWCYWGIERRCVSLFKRDQASIIFPPSGWCIVDDQDNCMIIPKPIQQGKQQKRDAVNGYCYMNSNGMCISMLTYANGTAIHSNTEIFSKRGEMYLGQNWVPGYFHQNVVSRE